MTTTDDILREQEKGKEMEIGKTFVTVISFVIALAIGFAVMLGLDLYEGWLFKDLWDWFVVPLGVRSISTVWSAGILAALFFPILSVTASMPQIKKNTQDEDANEALLCLKMVGVWFLGWFLGMNLMWLFGYIFHLFM